MQSAKPDTIDDYITGFPENIRNLLQQIRSTIKKTAPEAEEKISYGIPAFKLHGSMLVYFAAFKKHIGFYPLPGAIEAFEKEVKNFKTSGKGSIQFPLDQPIPLDLIIKIVKFRMNENFIKSLKKNNKKGGKNE